MAAPVASQRGFHIELPVREGNKAKWDLLKVKWVEPFVGNPFLVRAELPSGWSVKQKPATDFDKRNFIVLDSDGTPKAEVYVKTAAWDKWATVNIITGANAEKMKAALAPKKGQEEFDSLLAAYNAAIGNTGMMGDIRQEGVDEAYTKLEAFVNSHAEFSSDLPKKYQCWNLFH